MRHVWFIYADVACGSYPLATIDTIADDGTTDTTSAIYLIANGVNTYKKISSLSFIVNNKAETFHRKLNNI